MKLVPIKPKGRAVDYERIVKAVKDAMDEAAQECLEDFERTTATWEHKPAFEAVAVSDGYVVGTDDEIYGYVDEGTRPHVIVAKGKALAFGVGGAPKTQPGVIGSSGGSKGSGRVYVKRVNHPGTKPRNFTEQIHKKWQGQLPLIVAQKIGGAVGD